MEKSDNVKKYRRYLIGGIIFTVIGIFITGFVIIQCVDLYRFSSDLSDMHSNLAFSTKAVFFGPISLFMGIYRLVKRKKGFNEEKNNKILEQTERDKKILRSIGVREEDIERHISKNSN